MSPNIVGYLTAQAVADRLGVSIHTVRYWLRIGTLPSVRPGRWRLVREVDLERFLRRNARGESKRRRSGTQEEVS